MGSSRQLALRPSGRAPGPAALAEGWLPLLFPQSEMDPPLPQSYLYFCTEIQTSECGQYTERIRKHFAAFLKKNKVTLDFSIWCSWSPLRCSARLVITLISCLHICFLSVECCHLPANCVNYSRYTKLRGSAGPSPSLVEEAVWYV